MRSKKRGPRKFRSPPKKQLAGSTLRVPGSTGFTQLTGTAVYDQHMKVLMITITAAKKPDNYGPGIFEKIRREWDRSKTAADARKLLDVLLKMRAEMMIGRKLPEKDTYLEHCSPGTNYTEFMTTTCVSCRCWYCELSDA